MELELFYNKKPNFQKLQNFGFLKDGTCYQYTTVIADGQFAMTVSISEDGKVATKLVDCDSKEEYVLYRVEKAAGAFVGMVKNAHDDILKEIADTCFEMDVFKSETAQEVIHYVRDTYGEELEFLWKKFPNNAIWRRKDTNKWFGALLTVSKEKLGIKSDEMAEIIDLRIKPEKLESLVDYKKYYPGYHMNKKHWYTMILDGSVPVKEICERIDESYHLH